MLCNTREEMVTEARREIKDGVDIVKVAGDGDVLTGDAELAGSIGLDDLRAIAEVTHRLGKVCTIHARSGQAAADAIRAGFDWIIHGSYMSEDDLDVLFRNPTPLIPTFSLLANTLDWGPDLGCSNSFSMPTRTRSSGLPASLACPCRGNHHHRRHRQRPGLGALRRVARPRDGAPDDLWRPERHGGDPRGHRQRGADARHGGRDRHAGEGKLADILVVNGDPLADIAVLQDREHLAVVMKDGAVVDTEVPIPEPARYNWEKPMRYWQDPRMPTQSFVREHATSKPRWMQQERRLDAAE